MPYCTFYFLTCQTPHDLFHQSRRLTLCEREGLKAGVRISVGLHTIHDIRPTISLWRHRSNIASSPAWCIETISKSFLMHTSLIEEKGSRNLYSNASLSPRTKVKYFYSKMRNQLFLLLILFEELRWFLSRFCVIILFKGTMDDLNITWQSDDFKLDVVESWFMWVEECKQLRKWKNVKVRFLSYLHWQ